MKSAKDWLVDSSDDETNEKSPGTRSPAAAGSDADQTATAAAEARAKRQQEAEERRRKAAELRERMTATLGTVAIEDPKSAGAGPASVASLADGPPMSAKSPMIVRRKKSTSKSPAGNPPAPAAKPTASAALKDRLKGVLDSSDDSMPVSPKQTQRSDDAPATMPPMPVKPLSVEAMQQPPAVAEDEQVIMVANRGTQTACDVNVQTDPEPHTVSCPMCYSAYYGHEPAPPPLCGGGGTGDGHHAPANVMQFGGPHGFAFQPMHPMMHGPSGTAAAQALGRMTGVGYGAPQPHPASMTPRFVPMSVYQQQVQLIQRRVDAIIQKHNLPSMPVPS